LANIRNDLQLLRVLVHAPDPLTRAAICGLVKSLEYATVVKESSSLQSYSTMSESEYDVAVVTEGDMPMTSTDVILFIDANDRSTLADAVAAGVTRFVNRINAATDLEAGLKAVLQGHPYVPPLLINHLLALLAATIPNKVVATRSMDQLSPREGEVLMLIGEGRSNTAIAKELLIQETTVRSHVSRIQSKLYISTRVEAVLVGQRLRIDSSF
jgi:DNA-binding NarL/FixJ family response regulator